VVLGIPKLLKGVKGQTGTMPVEVMPGIETSFGKYFGPLKETQQRELMEAYKNAPGMDDFYNKQPDQIGSWVNDVGEIENNPLVAQNFKASSNPQQMMDTQAAIDTTILNQDAIAAQVYNVQRAKTLGATNGSIVRVGGVGDLDKATMRKLTKLDQKLGKEMNSPYGIFSVVPSDDKAARNIIFHHTDNKTREALDEAGQKIYDKHPEIAEQIRNIIGGSDDMTYVPAKIGNKQTSFTTYKNIGEDSAKYFYDEDVNPMLKNPKYVKALQARVKYLTEMRNKFHKINGQEINPWKEQAERIFVQRGPKGVKEGLKKWEAKMGKQPNSKGYKYGALIGAGAVSPAFAGEEMSMGQYLPEGTGVSNEDVSNFSKGLLSGVPEGATGIAGETERFAKGLGGLITGGFQDWEQDLTFTDRAAMAGQTALDKLGQDTYLTNADDQAKRVDKALGPEFTQDMNTTAGSAGRLVGQIGGEIATGSILAKLLRKGVKLTATQLAKLKQAEEMQNLGK
tara:strand:+ start:455 stop:1981 length:1527 start_codon:yes stop_codon:yes gene_type:complete